MECAAVALGAGAGQLGVARPGAGQSTTRSPVAVGDPEGWQVAQQGHEVARARRRREDLAVARPLEGLHGSHVCLQPEGHPVLRRKVGAKRRAGEGEGEPATPVGSGRERRGRECWAARRGREASGRAGQPSKTRLAPASLSRQRERATRSAACAVAGCRPSRSGELSERPRVADAAAATTCGTRFTHRRRLAAGQRRG